MERKFVTDLAAERAVLCKLQMMIIAALASADEAGLLGHKPHLLAIVYAPGLWMWWSMWLFDLSDHMCVGQLSEV